MGTVNKFSRIVGRSFRYPLLNDVSCKSHKLFVLLGLTPQFTEGIIPLTPILKKALGKLENLVRKEMRNVSAVEMSLPILSDANLFEISNRIDSLDLMKVKLSKNKNVILNPTCEEAITYFLKLSNGFNFAPLPIRLYQISPKFRNEKRVKSGLLRGKEFIMKDLYCFDADAHSSDLCYQEVVNQYHHLFNILQVPYKFVRGSTENMGGVDADEFHFLSGAGEDELILCENCGHGINSCLGTGDKNTCQKCQSKDVKIVRGIEVGHAFKLGTKFTEAFDVCNSKTKELLHMSCFGLGLSRILAASVEVLCLPDALRWPKAIAPYLVCVLPPKAGSHEDKSSGNLWERIYHNLDKVLEDEIIVDDRTDETIGSRFKEAKRLGFPYLVILGKSVQESPPVVEIYDLISDETSFVQVPDVTQFIMDKLNSSGMKHQCEMKA